MLNSARIYPVILSGGSGTRLWPLSRAALPKQFLPLVSEKTMLQETVLRLSGLSGVGPATVICSEEHRFVVAEQLREVGAQAGPSILEPVGRGTAPAVAVAALRAVEADPNAILLVLPADHLLQDVAAFHAAVACGVKSVEAGSLVAFGVTPTEPHTGYGYIRKGAEAYCESGDMPVYDLASFVEKPSREVAESMLATGEYCWNSGMFMMSAMQYLDELTKYAPDIVTSCAKALDGAQLDLDFIRLPLDRFSACRSDSIDYAVMERTENAVMIPVSMGLDDLGAWPSLWNVGQKDSEGNVVRGDVLAHEASNNYIHSERRLVAAVGVDNLVIVETADAVLVCSKDSAQDVKHIVDKLKAAGRTEHLTHTQVYRPWGWYEGIDRGERFQVKRIVLKPGEKLSLQMHHHRAEHWIVVAGTGLVRCGDKEMLLTENESTYIPLGFVHKLENPGKVPLELIEVQSGSYLGEDDIVRFEDKYNRV